MKRPAKRLLNLKYDTIPIAFMIGSVYHDENETIIDSFKQAGIILRAVSVDCSTDYDYNFVYYRGRKTKEISDFIQSWRKYHQEGYL